MSRTQLRYPKYVYVTKFHHSIIDNCLRFGKSSATMATAAEALQKKRELTSCFSNSIFLSATESNWNYISCERERAQKVVAMVHHHRHVCESHMRESFTRIKLCYALLSLDLS